MRRIRIIGGLVAVALLLVGCGGSSNPLSSSTGAGAAPGSVSGGGGGSVVVGSANFPESVLLAEIYAGALRAGGVAVSTRLNIGSRETYLPGLRDGSIDVVPEYTGVLLQYFDTSATATGPDQVYTALQKALPAGLRVLDRSAAQDKDAVVVTKATAAEYHLTSIGDLVPVARRLTFGGPPEFKTRADGVPGLARVYGVTFGSVRSLDAGGPLTVNALKNGQVQAADIFTTDPAIVADGFVVLADPKNLYLAQNVVPLLNAGKVTPQITAALNAVSGKLDTSSLTELDAEVISAKQGPRTVASRWLSQVGLA
jgi:osmoprotectant transport system substrate-binding protein